MAQLLNDVAEFVLFTERFFVIQDLTSKTFIGAVEERNGVYHYTGMVEVQAGSVGKLENRALWHRRLGHPSNQ